MFFKNIIKKILKVTRIVSGLACFSGYIHICVKAFSAAYGAADLIQISSAKVAQCAS